MDSRTRRRTIQRKPQDTQSTSRAAHGSRQICISMTEQQYHEIWDDHVKVRNFLDELIETHPDCFPQSIHDGYQLSGRLPESKKMPGIRWRQIRIGDIAYTLRPSFVMLYCTGTTDQLRHPLLLLAHGVPCWLITEVFGRNDMFWFRLLQSLGRNSLVGTTVFDAEHLPDHLAADEHHADWAGQKGYIATVAAEGCLLGVALTEEADQAHLEQAYGEFAEEAAEVSTDYRPETVNTDGWQATRNAFLALFSGIVPILCFLHGFLKIRDRGRKEHDLHERIWNVFHATHQ